MPMKWNTMTIEVDRDEIAKDFADYIAENGPYYVFYGGRDCELILKHQEPAPLDAVMKAIGYQKENIDAIRTILSDLPSGTFGDSAQAILSRLSNIEVICKLLETEWKDCYASKRTEG